MAKLLYEACPTDAAWPTFSVAWKTMLRKWDNRSAMMRCSRSDKLVSGALHRTDALTARNRDTNTHQEYSRQLPLADLYPFHKVDMPQCTTGVLDDWRDLNHD